MSSEAIRETMTRTAGIRAGALAGSLEVPTRAAELIEKGGLGLPLDALKIFDAHERRRYEIQADSRLSKTFAAEESARIDAETETLLGQAQAREVEAAREGIDKRRRQLLDEIKGIHRNARDVAETSDAQRERLARHSHDVIALNTDLLSASASGDPEDLSDSLSEAITAGDARRVRKLAPVILGRLAVLAEAKVAGADGAYVNAMGAWRTWKAAHPSATARLRALEAEARTVAAPIEQRYARAREHFSFGKRAFGKRI